MKKNLFFEIQDFQFCRGVFRLICLCICLFCIQFSFAETGNLTTNLEGETGIVIVGGAEVITIEKSPDLIPAEIVSKNSQKLVKKKTNVQSFKTKSKNKSISKKRIPSVTPPIFFNNSKSTFESVLIKEYSSLITSQNTFEFGFQAKSSQFIPKVHIEALSEIPFINEITRGEKFLHFFFTRPPPHI